jgi:hypothetical protein
VGGCEIKFFPMLGNSALIPPRLSTEPKTAITRNHGENERDSETQGLA